MEMQFSYNIKIIFLFTSLIILIKHKNTDIVQ